MNKQEIIDLVLEDMGEMEAKQLLIDYLNSQEGENLLFWIIHNSPAATKFSG